MTGFIFKFRVDEIKAFLRHELFKDPYTAPWDALDALEEPEYIHQLFKLFFKEEASDFDAAVRQFREEVDRHRRQQLDKA